jgi:hypothetical protein
MLLCFCINLYKMEEHFSGSRNLRGRSNPLSSGNNQKKPYDLHFAVTPNSFHHTTVCTWKLNEATEVKISLTVLAGKEVMKIFEGFMKAGKQRCEINGYELPEGLYFVKIETNGRTGFVKLIRQ